MKYVAAGMNPMDLKRGIDVAVEAVVSGLKDLAKPCVTHTELVLTTDCMIAERPDARAAPAPEAMEM